MCMGEPARASSSLGVIGVRNSDPVGRDMATRYREVHFGLQAYGGPKVCMAQALFSGHTIILVSTGRATMEPLLRVVIDELLCDGAKRYEGQLVRQAIVTAALHKRFCLSMRLV